LDLDRFRARISQQSRASVIPEGVRVAHVAAQSVDRLVSADIHHFKQAGASGGRAREKAGAEAVAREHFWVEPQAFCICLHDQGDVLRGQPVRKEPAALSDLSEDRPFNDVGSGEPRAATGQAIEPRQTATTAPTAS
jgi:hypothetical protein